METKIIKKREICLSRPITTISITSTWCHPQLRFGWHPILPEQPDSNESHGIKKLV